MQTDKQNECEWHQPQPGTYHSPRPLGVSLKGLSLISAIEQANVTAYPQEEGRIQ